jgi:outer membrane protein
MMKTLQSGTALLCAMLCLHAPLAAQPRNFFSGLQRNYQPLNIDPIRLNNSGRLEQLMRGGKIYLSLQDAIALALENNLDIELQRYGPELQKYDLLRANAGGVIRGVQAQATAGPSSAVNFVTGGFGGGTGQQNQNQGAGAGAQSGTVFQVTGTAIPALDPVFSTSLSRGKSSSPQTNSLVNGTTSLIVENLSFNSGIQKQFLTGTSASLNLQTNNIETSSPNSDLNPFNRGNMNVQISQRLLQGFGVAVNNRNIRISRNNIKVTELVFKQQLINTVSSIVNLYWDLVSFNEDVKVKRQAVAYAEKLYVDNKKQVEIGTLAPIEIVRAEAEVARTQQDLTISETNVLQQEQILKNALSRTGLQSVMVADARVIPTDRITFPDTEEVMPIQDMMTAAISARPEVEQTRINIENTKIGLAGARNQLLPSLDAFASFQNNALAGSINRLTSPLNPTGQRFVDNLVVGGYGTAIGQIFRRNFPDYTLGFQLNVPLRNRSAQADYANDTLRLRQQELQEQRLFNNIRLDVQNAQIAVLQARARHDAAVKARRLQEQNLEAEQKKYALGSSTIFLVIQAQRDLATSQGTEVSALANYSRSKIQLHVATGKLLETYRIDMAEAMTGKVSTAPTPLPPAAN